MKALSKAIKASYDAEQARLIRNLRYLRKSDRLLPGLLSAECPPQKIESKNILSKFEAKLQVELNEVVAQVPDLQVLLLLKVLVGSIENLLDRCSDKLGKYNPSLNKINTSEIQAQSNPSQKTSPLSKRNIPPSVATPKYKRGEGRGVK